ncbi:MAG: MFS transporter [Actinobacteria bacterium]|nr:MFS transporter [Actinomycetota bacterium]
MVEQSGALGGDRARSPHPYTVAMDTALRSPIGEEVGSSRRSPDWILLALACVAQFMVVLDVSIVNVALPSISRDLHYSASGLQWVVNAYVLTFAGFLLLGGRAADLFGRRKIFLLGLVIFSAASLLGGLAHTSVELTAARAAQGIGGAILSPATLTIIVTTFRGTTLARALGIWSSVAGAGGATGAILGGVLTSELSWRWVLFVNVPIGIVTTIAGIKYLSEARDTNADRSLDVWGAITVTLGLGALVFAIVNTDTYAWGSSRTLETLGVAAVLLGAFAVIQITKRSNPLVPFRLFKSRHVTGSNLVMVLIGAAFFSVWYFLSLYLQDVLGYDALKAGICFVPLTVSIVVGAQASSRLVHRLGVRTLVVVGTVIAAGGFFWLSGIEANGNYFVHVFGPGCAISLALGLLFTPLAHAATSGVAHFEAGLASGVLNTSRQVGGSVGLAALATIAISRTRSVLVAGHSTQAVALSAGYSTAFKVAAVMCLVATLFAFVVPRIAETSVE